jgi:hypothetical protein
MHVRTVTLRAAVILIGACTCLGVGVRAQEAPQRPPPAPITESAERLARELWPIDERGLMDKRGRPPFRSSVTATPLVLPLPWLETDAAWRRFQRPGRLYHQEFLSVVTPEAFRGGALAAAGVAVDPGAMFGGVKTAWRNWQARRVHERVEKEVAQLRARTTQEPAP